MADGYILRVPNERDQSEASPTTNAMATSAPPSSDPASDSSRNSRRTLVLICLVGTLVRLWVAFTPEIGYADDVQFFRDWTRGIHEQGLRGFLTTTEFCDYPPLWLLTMWLIGHTVGLFDPTLSNDYALHVLLKLPACAADLLIALALFWEGTRIFGRRLAVAAAALFFLNPLSIYNSAYWGQVDSIHTSCCLVSLMFVNRKRHVLAGACAAAALLQKFQSVAFFPIIIMDAYRRGGVKAIGFGAIGAICAGAIITSPFVQQGVFRETFDRAYIGVVGQYPDLSCSAYNLWWLAGDTADTDVAVPSSIMQAIAQGREIVPENDSTLLALDWRRISLILYSLVVAVLLSIYSLRTSHTNQFVAAGLLGLAFFLFPTEMHERYALPAMAFFPIWAVSGAWKERAFMLLTILLLLNMTDFLPAKPLSMHLSLTNLIVFGGLALWLFYSKPSEPIRSETPVYLDNDTTPDRLLVKYFRFATIGAVVATLGGCAWIQLKTLNASPLPDDPDVIYLSSLKVRVEEQTWGEIEPDRSVKGRQIHLGADYYLRGMGTHASSKLHYTIPEGAGVFEALVGIDRITKGKGSASMTILVDGVEIYKTDVLTGNTAPIHVVVPVRGGKTLSLLADPTPDGHKNDCVDWAMARFIRAGAEHKSNLSHQK